MFSREPWGGFGANPAPTRFQGLWEPIVGLVTGGAPYSEGIYNDMNMVIAQRHYWDANATAAATVLAYASFNFGAAVAPTVAAAVAVLEANWPSLHVPASARNASAWLEAVNFKLPPVTASLWRWRVLLLRSRIDLGLFNSGGNINCSDPEQLAAFAELARLYHVTNRTESFLRPPCT